jgi:uncharacterized protein (DUF58 family)
MRCARRVWVVVAAAGALASVGAVAVDPLLSGAGLALGAWLLANQFGFVRTVREVAAGDLTVEAVRERVAVDAPVVVRVRARVDRAFPFDLTVGTDLPPDADQPDAPTSVSLAAGERGAETAFETRLRVVGETTLGPAVASFRDTAGLFAGTVRGDDTVTVTVQPRAPTDLHVGEGGEPLTSLYGEHQTDATGAGLEPSGVREYVPGDQLSRIDWKATARLNHPHLRKFDVRTTHETVLVVDHRESMGAGPAGETKLDYLRGVALAFVNAADEYNDPLGLYAVGDGGTTTAREAAAGVEQYDPVRRMVERLAPTRAEPTAAPADGLVAPARARATATQLGDDDSRFARTLRPYFASTEQYVHRLNDRPLFRTVRAGRAALGSGAWTVILTDDTRPAETRETAKLARRNDGHVLVFLAPSVLYDAESVGDEAFERYLEFEEFRRSLAAVDRVSAFEVGPGDRLAAVIGRHDRARHPGRDVARAGPGPVDRGPEDPLAYSGSPRTTVEGEGEGDE